MKPTPRSVLDDLAPPTRAEVEALFVRQRHPDGATIFEQGDPATTAMWVESGVVCLDLVLPGEARIEVDRLGPGALLGELALVREGQRHLGARAEGDVVVQVLDRRDFSLLRQARRPASFALLLDISRRMAEQLVRTDAQTRDLPAGAVRLAPPPPTLGSTEAPGCAFDPRPYLGALPFFRDLSAPDHDALIRLGKLWTLPRGRVLIAEGVEARGIFIVVRGAVEICCDGLRLGLAGPGGLVGHLGPLLGTSPIATCRMREDGVVLQLDPSALERLLTPTDRLSYRFLDALCLALLADLGRANRVRAWRAVSRPHNPG